MTTLYYSPGACSMAVHVVLRELGQPVNLVNVNDESGARTKAFLGINPRGTVPVLEVDGTYLQEGAAILLYLLETYPNTLLPQKGLARAKALQWLMFANATLHPAYARAFFAKYKLSGDTQKTVIDIVVPQINALWAEVEQALATTPYICGEAITVADILLTVIANWSEKVSSGIQFGERTKKLFRSVIARPAYQAALAAEKVEYKAAA